VPGDITIEPLRAVHDRQEFSSGIAALDRYLHELATQDVRRRISTVLGGLAEFDPYADGIRRRDDR
jgi:hypothetical protein